jgi:hypothetical protein
MPGNLGLNFFAATGGVGPAVAASITSRSHNCLVLTASTDIPESTPIQAIFIITGGPLT